ncbi:MAG: hypothetical protein M1480_12915 [Bacteroidetes bacterium]|nr:hypothetical protein [Bacteroidota bacterium]
MKKKLFNHALLVFYFIFMFASTSFCQNDSTLKIYDKIAETSSIKLQQKILLSDKQTLQVKDILISYLKQTNKKESDSELLLSKIESLLNDKQKPKYEIIKTEWWNYVLKETSNLDKK